MAVPNRTPILLLVVAVTIAAACALEARKVLNIPEKIIGGVIDIVQNHKNKPAQVNNQQSQQFQQNYPQQYAPYQNWNANAGLQSSTQTQVQGQVNNGIYAANQFAPGSQNNQYPIYQGGQFQTQNQNFDQSSQFQAQAGFQGQYQVQNQLAANQQNNVNYHGSNQNYHGSNTGFQQNQPGFVGNQQTAFGTNHPNQGSATQGNYQPGFVGNQQAGFGTTQQSTFGGNQQAGFGTNQQSTFGGNQLAGFSTNQPNHGQTSFGTYPQGTQSGLGSQTSTFQGSGQGSSGFHVSAGQMAGTVPACICQAWSKPPEQRSEPLAGTTGKEEAKKTE